MSVFAKYITGDTVQYVIKLFGHYPFVMTLCRNGGWIRIYGYGISWEDKSKARFSLRNGLKKNRRIYNYYIEFLKPLKEKN